MPSKGTEGTTLWHNTQTRLSKNLTLLRLALRTTKNDSMSTASLLALCPKGRLGSLSTFGERLVHRSLICLLSTPACSWRDPTDGEQQSQEAPLPAEAPSTQKPPRNLIFGTTHQWQQPVQRYHGLQPPLGRHHPPESLQHRQGVESTRAQHRHQVLYIEHG